MGDPQSPGFNDLNRVIERDHVVWRTGLYVGGLVLVSAIVVCLSRGRLIQVLASSHCFGLSRRVRVIFDVCSL